ncbi:MAG: DUF4386 family protein, partial [Candidatus Sumerlaeia bacterium]|nr:DUF4386 family protein [Candidatus Sumerlaeia bacterium]
MKTHPLIPGVAILVWISAVNIPYIHLMNIFDYDDILREPAADVLASFALGGNELILTWYAFGLMALAFAPLLFLLSDLFPEEIRQKSWYKGAVMAGGVSAVVQAAGLLRWAFVIPILARHSSELTAGGAEQQGVILLYEAVHQFGGVVLGETIGQLLLAWWTFGFSLALWQSKLVP